MKSKPSINRLLPIWEGLALNDRWSEYVTEEDVKTYSRRMRSEGPEFYARAMAQLRKDFLSALQTGSFQTTARFGQTRNSVLPRWLNKAFAAVFTDQGELLSNVDVDAVTCVNQLTAVFTKIRGGHTPQSESKTIERFVQTESEMAEFQLDLSQPVHRWTGGGDLYRRAVPLGEILVEARRLIGIVLAGSDPREIVPKHGSGVSACGTPIWERYGRPRYVEKINRIWPMDEYYYASLTAFCDELHEYTNTSDYDPCAKVLLVPKDARGPRLISCEPRETMWIQQGLMRLAYETIEEHSLTRGLVNFTNQTYNQIAAYAGSKDPMPAGVDVDVVIAHLEGDDVGMFPLDARTECGRRLKVVERQSEMAAQTSAILTKRYGNVSLSRFGGAGKLASLDLTDASDKLHLGVVECLFPSNWYEALEACRSDKTELPDGSLVSLSKHAPMGSAVCFPIMALTIWSVLTAIAPKTSHKEILVYGDDIIVPCYLAEDACQVLEAIGFTVNRTKSFTRGRFRESCGEEFYEGVRVTPVYLRQDPDDDTESMTALLAFSNNMLDAALGMDNSWMLSLIDAWYGTKHPILYMEPSMRAHWFGIAEQLRLAYRIGNRTFTGVAYTCDPTMTRYPGGRRKRRNKDLQRSEFRVLVPEPLYHCYDIDDWSHVLRSLVNPVVRDTVLRGRALRELDVGGKDAVNNCVRYVYRWCCLD